MATENAFMLLLFIIHLLKISKRYHAKQKNMQLIKKKQCINNYTVIQVLYATMTNEYFGEQYACLFGVS